MKNINVLGVQFNDMSVREAMKLVSMYLSTENLNTVCFATTRLLLEARDSEEFKHCIESMDLVIPATTDIFPVTGYRAKEIANNVFLHELLKKFSREKMRIFIVGATEEEQVRIRESLLSINEGLTFFGCFSYNADQPGVDDSLINEINSVLPDVVISNLESPLQEQLVNREKQKVNARIWVSLQNESLKSASLKKRGRGWLVDFFDRFIFKRVVDKYDSKKKEGNERV